MHRVLLFLVFLAILPAALSAADGSYIHLKYASFDPLVGEPAIPTDLRAKQVPSKHSYYIVQFRGPVEFQWKDELSSLGVAFLDYIPDFAFVVRMTPEVMDKISAVQCVRWVGLYHPAYGLSPDIEHQGGLANVVVQLFSGEPSARVEAEIVRAGGLIRERASGPAGEHIDALVPARALRRIVLQKGVSWIEPRLERKLYNDVGRGIMNLAPVWTDVGLFGSGETVGVCDTGLDTGNTSTISADFAGRVTRTYALGRKNKWDDPHGHGTHVAGSVLGSGMLSGSNPAAHYYSSSFAGIAPESELVFQSVLDNSGGLRGIPTDLNQLFQPPYDDGARIHTNSWGAPYNGVYTTDSRNLDMFTWNHKDMTVLMAAGNEAKDANSNGVVDADSLSSPATAKNCITVGASESYRLSGGAQSTYGAYWAGDFPADPIKSDRVSNNSSGMVAFSGRGPCDDGRIKPDVCAPGTNIISCRSHVAGAGTLWGTYNSHYVYSGGTSMAAPLVAGASTLVREYYRTREGHVPTAALIKATLVNGAISMYPGQYGTGGFLEIPASRPNNVEGWGRVDLENAIMADPPRLIRFVDDTAGLTTGSSQVYEYVVTGSTSPFRATLVWTDYPASTSASKALVNDLDLTVMLPSGSTVRGNGTTDRLNNIEGVDIGSPAPGTYRVTVSAYNVPNGPQPYALVVSGDTGVLLPTAAIDVPSDGTPLFGSVNVKGTASGEGFLQYILEYGAGPSPSSWTPIGLPGASPVTGGLLGIWDTTPLADGTYTLRLTVSGAAGDSVDQVTVSVQRTSIFGAKANPDGTTMTLTGKVVSAGPLEFGTTVYVQEPDRSSGLKIDLGIVTTDAVIGNIATVSGTLQTSEGERVLTDPSILITGSGPEPVPLSVTNRDTGGSALGEHTPGVTGGVGLHNLSLLVCTWGQVTSVGSDYFYMDDGSALLDGSGSQGIKVHTGTLTRPSLGDYAIVVGISSAELSGSTVRRVVRPRRQSDLLYY